MTREGQRNGSRPWQQGRATGRSVVVAVTLLAVAACGQTPEAADSRPGIAHVHGLGVDPADNTLYAGTHHGVFRGPAEGVATPVGDLVQDYMGFTVVGPRHYLASGHPGAGLGGPSSLGLIESTDGGQSWKTLSLAGEADFHALRARHGKVYGWNSANGALMVSSDRTTWETRSTLSLADFAVSPRTPDEILATTAQGLQRSVDGGRTFTPVPGAPLLLLVAWADDGTVYGIDPTGIVHVSADGGRTWEQRGSVGGAPAALTAVDASTVHAATADRIVSSRDGGRTFVPLYSSEG